MLIVCGSGNNGADGYALARRIAGDIPAAVYAACDAKTENCKRERDSLLVDEYALADLLRAAHTHVGVTGLPALATNDVLIRSVATRPAPEARPLPAAYPPTSAASRILIWTKIYWNALSTSPIR